MDGVLDGQKEKIDFLVQGLNTKHKFHELKGHYTYLTEQIEHYRKIYVQKTERLKNLTQKAKLKRIRTGHAVRFKTYDEDSEVSYNFSGVKILRDAWMMLV